MARDGGSVCMCARVFINQFMASRRMIILYLLLSMASVNLLLMYFSSGAEPASYKQSRDYRIKQKLARAPRSASVSAQQLSNVLNSWMDFGNEDESSNKMGKNEDKRREGSTAERFMDRDQSITGIGEVALKRLEVKASEAEVDIRLNDQCVYHVNTSSVQFRGLHVLVISQTSGDVMTRRRFDTVLRDVYRDVITFLNAVHAGRIMVFASADDFTYSLHADLRYRLAEMGSQFAPNLNFRDQWAMVTIKGSGESLGEAHSPSPASEEHGGPLFLRVDLPIGALPGTESCKWPESRENERRRSFCSRHEGYAGLCRCLQPHTISPVQSPIELGLHSVYTVVLATHRPHYLYNTLKSLAMASGTLASNVVVYLENEEDQELKELVELFDFRVRFIPTTRSDGSSSERLASVISSRVMTVIDDTFQFFPDADSIIFLEEDLQCSPDFYIYFSELRHLLDQDESIFTISAFNIHASRNTSHAPSEAYRVDSFSPVAFLLSKSTYLDEIKPLWPQYAERADWNLFLDRVVRKQRECVVPDVNRVYHTGRDSILVNAHAFNMFYQNLSFNPDPHVRLHELSRLHKSEYETLLEETLKAATIVEEFSEICSVQNMTAQFKPSNRTEVIFFEMNHANDISTWKNLAQCWGLWSENTDGNHGGLWRFWMENKKGFLFQIIMIGVPHSRYSRFKPSSLEPYRTQEADAAKRDGTNSAQPKQKGSSSTAEKHENNPAQQNRGGSRSAASNRENNSAQQNRGDSRSAASNRQNNPAQQNRGDSRSAASKHENNSVYPKQKYYNSAVSKKRESENKMAPSQAKHHGGKADVRSVPSDPYSPGKFSSIESKVIESPIYHSSSKIDRSSSKSNQPSKKIQHFDVE